MTEAVAKALEAQKVDDTRPRAAPYDAGFAAGWNRGLDAAIASLRAADAGVPPIQCTHNWHDYGQLGGRNVSWCPRCDTLAFTGKEPDSASPGAPKQQSQPLLTDEDWQAIADKFDLIVTGDFKEAIEDRIKEKQQCA